MYGSLKCQCQREFLTKLREKKVNFLINKNRFTYMYRSTAAKFFIRFKPKITLFLTT